MTGTQGPPPLPHLPVGIEAPADRLVVLTDRRQCTMPLADVVTAAIAGGARIFLFREKDLDLARRSDLAAPIAAAVTEAGGLFLAASTSPFGSERNPAVAGPIDGIHLASPDPMPSDRPTLLGRSCHGPEELAAAEIDGCDYATISPIFATDSKPGYGPALGIDGLAELVRSTGLPLVALAGIDAANAAACLKAGAAAVAVMGDVMRSPEPHATTAQLLEAIA